MCHNKDIPFLYLHTYLVSKEVYLFVKRVDLFRKKGLPFYYKERLFLQRAMLVTTKKRGCVWFDTPSSRYLSPVGIKLIVVLPYLQRLFFRLPWQG